MRDEPCRPVVSLTKIDAALIAVLIALELVLVARAGFRAGTELFPFPDALEYAAVAVNLNHGLGPVLHFGGHSYPSRYPEGYPLILAAAYRVLGSKVERLCLVTVMTGLIAIAALYVLSLRIFDRTSAFFASLLLATSPLFIGFSTLVMSDVPVLGVTLLALLVLLYAMEGESAIPWVVCGLLAGLSVIIRPTNATIVIGVVAGMAAAPPRKPLGASLAFLAGFALFPAWQALGNYRYLGRVLASGYSFWLPGLYGSFAMPFRLRFLFASGLPQNPHGNLLWYSAALLGLDGLFSNPHSSGREAIGNVHYSLYPLAAAPFAIFGIISALRDNLDRTTRRAVWFGLGFLCALLAVYLLYFYIAVVFILPAAFILFAAAGNGLVSANRRMSGGLASAAVLAADALLAGMIVTGTLSWAAAAPEKSQIVTDLISSRPLMKKAILVSDVSLQFLELYTGGPDTEFVALNGIDTGQRSCEYHMAYLLARKARGWNGPIPAVLFPNGVMDTAEERKLADQARSGRPLYLLVKAPEQPAHANFLRQEIEQLDFDFSRETVMDSEALALFRLKPR